MQKYLAQLLADIAAAHRPDEVTESADTPGTLVEELEEVERLMLTEPKVTFGQHCGLQAEQFPPAERWSAQQLQEINEAFKDMMFSWWVTADLPDDLPPDQRYQWLLKALDEKIHLMDMGFTGIIFCEEEPLTCPFGEAYCTCGKQIDAWEHNRQTSETHEQVEALLFDIREKVEAMPETLEFHDALADMEQDAPEEQALVYKPLAEWLEIDLKDFPPSQHLTNMEMSALAEELLSIFNPDDELAMIVRSVEDPARRYEAALEYYAIPVHHDGMGNWHFKPISLEAQKEMLKGLTSPFDFLDLEGLHPPRREYEDDGTLPF